MNIASQTDARPTSSTMVPLPAHGVADGARAWRRAHRHRHGDALGRSACSGCCLSLIATVGWFRAGAAASRRHEIVPVHDEASADRQRPHRRSSTCRSVANASQDDSRRDLSASRPASRAASPAALR